MLEMHAIASGVVQGIGFRSTVKSIAQKIKIVGFVRNLENGSVEICAQGSKEDLETFMQRIQEKFSPKYLQKLELRFYTSDHVYKNFFIQKEEK